MRFLLLEDNQQNADYDITPELINEFQHADPNRRKTIIHIIMNKMKDESVNTLSNAFSKSCIEFGIDTNKNPFMMFIPLLGKHAKVDKKHDAHVCQLIDLVLQGWIPRDRIQKINTGSANPNSEYLLNKSLYFRNLQDFLYTVKVFEIVQNPARLKKYFKSSKKIDTSQLFDEKGNIKPAGTNNDEENLGTIFGTVESWSEGGKNDASAPKKRSTNKRNSASKSKKKKDSDGLTVLTDEEKAQIKKECQAKGITHLSDIQNPYVGQRVFVNGKSKTADDWASGFQHRTADAGYYQFTTKGWAKVAEPERTPIYVTGAK